MLRYNIEVNATIVVDVVDPVEEVETLVNAYVDEMGGPGTDPPTPLELNRMTHGGSRPGHGLGTPKSCSVCGREGFNARTHPLHGDGC